MIKKECQRKPFTPQISKGSSLFKFLLRLRSICWANRRIIRAVWGGRFKIN